jgi:Protein of unknown function (DUF2877)
VRCLAAASSALRSVLAGPARPAALLGATRGALYLKTCGPPGALVVLSRDAVRLPCGLLLPTTSSELALASLALPSAEFAVGDGTVSWTGPAGPVVVRAVREWAPARPARGEVSVAALAAVRSCLDAAGPRVDDQLVTAPPQATRLLGSGPGLTPTGDDVLAGFLTGASAFGLDAAVLRRSVTALAPVRTTALSAAMLWHAARGECIDELAAVAAVLTSQPQAGRAGDAVSRLAAVGHSSGAAMALGLVAAAESALRSQAGRAA